MVSGRPRDGMRAGSYALRLDLDVGLRLEMTPWAFEETGAASRVVERCVRRHQSISRPKKETAPTVSTVGPLLGSGNRARTCDKSVNSRLLYQLSYAGPGWWPGI